MSRGLGASLAIRWAMFGGIGHGPRGRTLTFWAVTGNRSGLGMGRTGWVVAKARLTVRGGLLAIGMGSEWDAPGLGVAKAALDGQGWSTGNRNGLGRGHTGLGGREGGA
jgi:hypothetical protein